jgi:type I restriction enzyme R subunit
MCATTAAASNAVNVKSAPDGGLHLLDVQRLNRRRPRTTGAGEYQASDSAGLQLKGLTAAGSAATRDPKLVAFQEVIDRLNELFGDDDFSTGQKHSFVEGLLRTLLEDETLVTQDQANTQSQFLQSRDLTYAIIEAVLGNQTSDNKIADVLFSEGTTQQELVQLIDSLFHLHAAEPA